MNLRYLFISNKRRFNKLIKKLKPRTKETVLEQLLRNEKGRTELAKAMANPLISRLDYGSVFERTFVVDPLPRGSLPYLNYDAQS